MAKNDYYGSMSELLRREDETDYEIVVEETGRDPRVVIMAPHGGGIEPHIDELAQEIAADEFAFYTFRGLKNEDNYELLHVESTSFDEPEAVRLAEHAEVVLAVHGKSGEGEFTMVGGRHPELVGEVKALLEELGIETRDPSPSVAARSWDNICNRCQEGGVQLELSLPLRELLTDEPQVREQLTIGIRNRLRSVIEDSNK